MKHRIGHRTLLALLCAVLLAGCNAARSRPAAMPPEVPSTVPAPAQPTTTGEVAGEPPEATPAASTTGFTGEILFLREGNLVALDVATAAERTLADGVADFAAAPDGGTLALIRRDDASAELWLVGRDGGDLRRLTMNDRFEAGPRWSPDGSILAYTSSALPAPRTPDWLSWSAWCLAGEPRVISATGGPERSLGAGCEPVFSPDGWRLLHTTPPSAEAPDADTPSAGNTITVTGTGGEYPVVVAASGGADNGGHLVYSPAWSPDGERIMYHRFLGYQSLVDMTLTEEVSMGDAEPAPLDAGAGWLRPPLYAPGGGQALIVGYNFSDERGFGGYEGWSVSVLRPGQAGEVMMADGPLAVQATVEEWLPRATGAAWVPDGSGLAVVLPTGWRADAPQDEPVFTSSGPGELWLWRPGAQPERRVAVGVDFASPVLWLRAP